MTLLEYRTGPGGLDPRFPLSRRELLALGRDLLDLLGLSGRTFELILVSDAEMVRVNAEFSGLAFPTNVLSFPASESLDGEGRDLLAAFGDGCGVNEDDFPAGPDQDADPEAAPDPAPDQDVGQGDSNPAEGADPAFLGSIVLSVDTLAREAHLYGQDPQAHLARLLSHALLHLSGVPHGEEMEDLTDRAVLGVCGAGG